MPPSGSDPAADPATNPGQRGGAHGSVLQTANKESRMPEALILEFTGVGEAEYEAVNRQQ